MKRKRPGRLPSGKWELEALDRYERMWGFEMEAREQLTGRLQYALGFVTAAMGSIWYLALESQGAIHAGDLVNAVFTWSFSVAAGCTLMAVFWFARAAWGHKYGVLPVANILEEHRQVRIRESCPIPEAPFATSEAYARFRDDLIAYYTNCQSTNAIINQLRYEAIHRTTGYVFAGMISAFVAALCYGLAASVAGQ